MIIKLAHVRNGEIIDGQFYSSHETIMVPIFSQADIARHEAAWKVNGSKSLVCCAPNKTTGDKVKVWFANFAQHDLPKYLGSLPPKNNPFITGVQTPGGLLIPGDVGMRVSGPDNKSG